MQQASAADLFLKSITVNAANDGIVFTTGTATDTSHDSTLELPMASFLTGVAKETDLQTVKDEISSLTNEVNSNTSKIDALTQSSQSGIGSKTLDELVTELTANTAFMDAIKASLKGEEIQAVDGTTKGYLINA